MDGDFYVRITHREHATWQGEVTWVSKQEKRQFRSALELLRMIDSVLDETDEEQSPG